jgi:nitroreductase
MTSFLELARARRSIRAYAPRPVEEDKLQAVLEAGRLAPSACNLQPWRFVVVRDPEERRRFKAVYDKPWFYEQAPVIVAVCCEAGSAWVRKKDGKNHGEVDCAIAVDHMTLCAQDLGLGTCWICAFDPVAARELLGCPWASSRWRSSAGLSRRGGPAQAAKGARGDRASRALGNT